MTSRDKKWANIETEFPCAYFVVEIQEWNDLFPVKSERFLMF
jgi:hypothetical protein